MSKGQEELAFGALLVKNLDLHPGHTFGGTVSVEGGNARTVVY
jgi:hypothetical protein